MSEKAMLDLPVLLPDALDGRDRCVDRLTSTLTGASGLDQVHVIEAADGAPARLCLHYDPAVTSMARIRSLATGAGASITDQFGHVLWPVTGIGHVRKARSVREALGRIEGVIEADVAPGLVMVEFDRTRLDDGALREALQRRGVKVQAPGEDPEAHDHPKGQHDHGGPFGERSELVFAITSAALWTVGFVLELATDLSETALTLLFIAAGVFGGYFTAREALESVRNRRFEIDFLMLVAAAGAAALGKWEEGALLLALFSLGHALEGYAMGRARRAIEALGELAPKTATVRAGTDEREIPVEQLSLGDVVIVKPNERIPADGFVVAGTSSVNQAPLTGESIPVDKVPVRDPATAAASPEAVPASSRLFAGTINGAGQLDAQVTRLTKDSTLSKLATMVREAETQASPTQQFTDRFERIFVPAVLVLVVGVLIIGAALGSPLAESFYRAMAVLVAASPCALAIATPSAVLAAVGRAGQLGVLVKGGGPLEHLGTLRAIAFDKTGTLTEGRPKLTDVAPAEGVDHAELLAVAVAVEERSDHPLAAAIVRDGGAELEGESSLTASQVTAITGRGVRATVGATSVLIGNVALFEENGGLPQAVADEVRWLNANGRTIMIVKQDDRFLGVLGVRDTPRPGARQAVLALQSVGIRRAIMLSGDSQQVADAIAGDVGLTDAWGDLMPEDKVTAIERLRDEEGKVAMIGDGVNDAPALAHATVGIAMGAAGSDVALETADIALMGDDLSKLPVVIGLSRKASGVIRQNLFLSLGMVTFLIPATLIGFVGIGPAVVFHEGSTLVVVANALRLLAYRPAVPSVPSPDKEPDT
ncbi:MAG: heavy metal translocating P-type ATPase [Acidimicrobiales bacterium]|nr:heavy metal translocating P-type ATPase [Acidimicrobiales bacterium]